MYLTAFYNKQNKNSKFKQVYLQRTLNIRIVIIKSMFYIPVYTYNIVGNCPNGNHTI
jgi:hypothetical protein